MGLCRCIRIEELKSRYYAYLNVHQNDQTTNKHSEKNILNAILLSDRMSINCSEIITYEKIHFDLKNVQNVLGILLKAILKIRNNCSYKNFYSKNCRMLHGFNILFRYFLRKEKVLKLHLKKYIMWLSKGKIG